MPHQIRPIQRISSVQEDISSGDYYSGFGGTSAACPYAAGAAAVLQQAAKAKTGAYLTPAQVKSYLVNNGDNVTDGKIAVTKPRINLGRAVDAITHDSVQAPKVTISPAGKVTSNSATLNGTVNPNGLSTTYYFEWGTTTAYGNKSPATPASAGSGWDNVAVSVNLTGLKRNTTYHYRLVATNSLGPPLVWIRALRLQSVQYLRGCCCWEIKRLIGNLTTFAVTDRASHLSS